jgi:hypothetical protein
MVVVALVVTEVAAARADDAPAPPPAAPPGESEAPAVNEVPAPMPPPAMLEATPPEPPPVILEAGPPPRPPRPRLSVAIGPGMTFEQAGLSQTRIAPAFFATGGVGADWRVGAELAAFASSATGRFKAPETPVDRLALSAIAVVRPLAWTYAADAADYGLRVLRSMGAELGLGLERDGQSLRAGSRFGLHLGARVELPITPWRSPAGGSELRIRLAARRMQGLYTPIVGTTEVGNGVEVYTALVSVF